MKPQSRDSRYLTEPQRRAVIAAVAQGNSQASVARDFGVHPNTVYALVKSVREANIGGENNPLALQAKDKRGAITLESYEAVKRSVSDTKQVHPAANTALAWLKGMGELAGEGSTTINVTLNLIRSLPADVQQEYLVTDIEDGVINVTPTASDPHP